MTDCGSLDDGISHIHCSHRHYDEDEMGRIALDKNHILVGCTGSVASLLTPRLVEELASLKYNVRNTFTVKRMKVQPKNRCSQEKRPGFLKILHQLIHMNLSNYFFRTDSVVLISITCGLLAL